MFLLFLLLWILYNGKVTAEILIFGLIIAAAMYAFTCKYLDYSPGKDLLMVKRFFLLFRYFYVLVCEIVKSSFCTIGILFNEREQIEPAVVRFKSGLSERWMRVLLANSITLTPGTISVSLENDDFCVYCLDKSLAEGISESIFVRELERIERVR